MALIRMVAAFAALVLPAAMLPAQSISALTQQAQQGVASAQYQLGVIYLNGRGVARDAAQGLMWLRKAAEQSYAPAELDLGGAYYRGAGVQQSDVEAVKWIRRAAEHGSDRAQALMGVYYKLGGAVTPRNYSEAARWFRMAARQQSAEAQASLAEMHKAGLISEREADWQFEPTARPSRPFSAAEVEKAIRGGITNRRIATLLRQYGVDFPLTQSVEAQLRAAGADAELLSAIAAARR